MTLAQAHLHIYALGAVVTRPKACPHNYEARCWACCALAEAYAEALGEAHDLDVRDADGVGASTVCTRPGPPAPAAHGEEVLAGEVAVTRPCRWCGSPTDASARMCLACWEGGS